MAQIPMKNESIRKKQETHKKASDLFVDVVVLLDLRTLVKTSPQVAILVTCANFGGLTFKQAWQRETKFCLNENFRHVTRLVNSTYVLPVTVKHRNVFISFIAARVLRLANLDKSLISPALQRTC